MMKALAELSSVSLRLKLAANLARVVRYGMGQVDDICESPHLYKMNGYYYLLAAEGGTEYGHMVTYARGTSSSGPFEAYAHNPVLNQS